MLAVAAEQDERCLDRRVVFGRDVVAPSPDEPQVTMCTHRAANTPSSGTRGALPPGRVQVTEQTPDEDQNSDHPHGQTDRQHDHRDAQGQA